MPRRARACRRFPRPVSRTPPRGAPMCGWLPHIAPADPPRTASFRRAAPPRRPTPRARPCRHHRRREAPMARTARHPFGGYERSDARLRSKPRGPRRQRRFALGPPAARARRHDRHEAQVRPTGRRPPPAPWKGFSTNCSGNRTSRRAQVASTFAPARHRATQARTPERARGRLPIRQSNSRPKRSGRSLDRH